MITKLAELLNRKKTDYTQTLNVKFSQLVSDAELIIQDKSYFISELGGEIQFWDAVIEWCKTEYSYTKNLPLNRGVEKQLIIQSLSAIDMTLMSKEEHSRLYATLINELNGSATTLAINRSKGGKATRKITNETEKNVLARFKELEELHPKRYKNSHIDSLEKEFVLSATSIKKIIKGNGKR